MTGGRYIFIIASLLLLVLASCTQQQDLTGQAFDPATCTLSSQEVGFDVETISQSQLESNKLMPGFSNPPLKIFGNSYWSADTQKFVGLQTAAGDTYTFQSKNCYRNVEISLWTRRGTMYLRANQGFAYEWAIDGEQDQITVSMVTGLTDDKQSISNRYVIGKVQLDQINEYDRSRTADDLYKLRVDGTDITMYFNGKEIWRGSEYRMTDPGRIYWTNAQGYGIRGLTIKPLDRSIDHYYSDFDNDILDMRDFGIKEAVYSGRMQSGSNQLRLEQPANILEVGDSIIVEIGGEAGQGLRGSEGVGGFWPSLRYSSVAQMESDTSQNSRTYAYNYETDTVHVFYKSSGWSNSNRYYQGERAPLSLVATITAISSDRKTLTLDKQAQATTSDALVHHDNGPIFRKLLAREQGYTNRAHPEPFTIKIPPGRFAGAGQLSMRDRDNWKIEGAGVDQTLIFSPKGVRNHNFIFSEVDNVEVRDIHYMGNARDQGYYPDRSTGFHGSRADNLLLENLAITDVFQKAVGSDVSNNAQAKHITVRHNDGLRSYVQWMLQWADGTGGGCTDCVVVSDVVTAGVESFSHKDALFKDIFLINAIIAHNSADGQTLENAVQIIEEGAYKGYGNAQPIGDQLYNINDNIGRASGANAYIRNYTMIHEGYADQDSHIYRGIGINHNVWSEIVLEDIRAYGPDEDPNENTKGSTVVQAVTVNQHVDAKIVVDGIHAIGAKKDQTISAAVNVQIPDNNPESFITECVADSWNNDVRNDCQTNQQAGMDMSLTEIRKLSQQLQQQHNIQERINKPLQRLDNPHEGEYDAPEDPLPTPNQAPSVQITEPTNGHTMQVGESVQVQASAADADGQVARVDFFVNGGAPNPDTASPFRYQFSPSNSASYVITARAEDNDGATSTSQPITITVGTPQTGNYLAQPATQPIDLPTYDGLGQTTHPDVLDMAWELSARGLSGTTWNGYRYWMVHTPYPNADSSKENPSILVSNTGLAGSWIEPPGITNPVYPYPGGGASGVQSDADITLSADGSTLYMTWRNQMAPWPANNYLVGSSTNGVDWSEPVQFDRTEGTDTDRGFVSPSVVYNPDSGLYEMFIVRTGGGRSNFVLAKRTASNFLGSWSDEQNLALTGLPNPPYMWHIDVRRDQTPSGTHEYRMAMNVWGDTQTDNEDMYYCTSSTGNNFDCQALMQFNPNIAWSADGFYRGTLVPTGTVGEAPTGYRMWYGAISENNVWKVGETSFQLFENSQSDSNPQEPQITLELDTSRSYAPARILAEAFVNDPDSTQFEIDFFIDGDFERTERISPYEMTSEELPAGSYTVRAEVTDDQGLTDQVQETITLQERSNTAPSIDLALDANSQEAPTTITITADVNDPESDEVTLTLRKGTTNLGVETINGQATISHDYDAAEAGTYTFTAIAEDEYGATNTDSTSIELEQANRKPDVGITVTTTGSALPRQANIDATASDPDGNLQSVTLAWALQGQMPTIQTLTDPYDSTVELTQLGTYVFEVRAEDSEGEFRTASDEITLTNQPNNPPTIELQASKSNTTAPATIMAQATTDDPDGDALNIDFFINEVPIESTGNTIEYVASQAGLYTILAIATDSQGASAQDEAQISLDQQENSPPVATLEISSDTNVAPTELELTYTLSDPDSINLVGELSLDDEILQVATEDGSYTYEAVDTGEYLFTFRVTDEQGLTNTVSRPITILSESNNDDDDNSGNGGSGGSGFSFTGSTCQSEITCTDWSNCVGGEKTRTCSDANSCESDSIQTVSCSLKLSSTLESEGVDRQISLFEVNGVYVGDFRNVGESITLTISEDQEETITVEDRGSGEQYTLYRIAPGVYSNNQPQQTTPTQPRQERPEPLDIPGPLGETDAETQFDYLLIFGIIAGIILIAGVGVEGRILLKKHKQNDQLRQYIQTYKTAGKDRLKEMMVRTGWKEKRVDKLLDEELGK